MRFRAVVFDLWQTLVPWDEAAADAVYGRMCERIGVDRERFDDVWRADGPQRWIGSLAESIRTVCEALGVPDADVDELLALRTEGTRRVFSHARMLFRRLWSFAVGDTSSVS